jgi:protein gp37
MNETKIAWVDFTWNPVTGCTPVSEGCEHCYAERVVNRLRDTDLHCGCIDPACECEGEIRADHDFSIVHTHPERLEEPMHRRKPARILVCSMSDLFHPDVPDKFIQAVFTTMANARQHTFLILTKRPERMKKIICNFKISGLTLREGYGAVLPNVWLGVTAENQARADERIPILLQIPAAKRFVSIEPMLGPVDLQKSCGDYIDPLNGNRFWEGCNEPSRGIKLDWVIVGGETGPGARECCEEWIQGVYDQSQEAGVPFFFKQGGQSWTIKSADYSDLSPKRAKRLLDVKERDWMQRREWPK